MIVDKLENVEMYYVLGERYKKAFEYLKSVDLKNLENGKYSIDGEEIFVSVQDYETKSELEGKFEAHKKYADVQFIITGREKIGYENIKNCKETTFYDDKNDIVFLENKTPYKTFVNADENTFLIFTPQDAHMPCITIENSTYVKKAVVKVKIV